MIIALDLETTGLDSKNDKIIEIALVKFDEKTFQIIEEFSSLVNPEIDIPDIASNITSITNEDVINAPKWKDIQVKVEDFIGDYPILGHNVYFDKDFLMSNLIDIENNITLDTFLFANSLNLQEKSLSLESLTEALGIKLEGAHRALNDTVATIKLFEKLVNKLLKFSVKKKLFFKYIVSSSLDTGFNFILDNYIDKKIKLLNDNDFVKEFTKVFPLELIYDKKVVDKKIKTKDINKILSNISGLEIRNNQSDMIDIISNAFKNKSKVAIEAPTGVGKTFAYILPSIIYSIKTGEQVYISTTTKALQDQLYYKDLQFLINKLDLDFTFSKLKGKSNYIGINSFMSFINEEDTFSKEKTSFILKILYWINDTKFGELDELDYFGQEYLFLKEVNADDALTFSGENTYEDYEFAVKARRQSRQSNIVIINNNILFQDIDGNNNILGKVNNLVLDEVHNLEDVSTSSLKKNFSIKDVLRSLDNISKHILNIENKIPNFNNKKEQILFELGTIFDLFSTYLYTKVSSDSKYKTTLLKNDFDISDINKKELLNSISIKIIEFIDSFSILSDKLYLKISKEIQFFEKILDILSILLDNEKSNKYIQIITENDSSGLLLEYTYLRPGEYLKKYLWNNMDTCIITSATLKVQDSFDYITNMLSLEDFKFHCLESDFNYKKQSTLFIPNSLGNIKYNSDVIITFLCSLFKIVKGSSLVLFTSFASIKDTYISLNNEMKKEKINLIAQGIGGGKHKLIEKFKSSPNNSILLGTDSFWEGVDIPGEALKYLIIYKIPFSVPTDPIFIARSSLFKDPFLDYSIPKSIIKLKQGFGRLIRTKEDKGVVIFLDDRIFSTKWGDVFFSAFPSDINIKIGDHKKFLDILK